MRRFTSHMPSANQVVELQLRCGDVPIKAAVVADDASVLMFSLSPGGTNPS